MTEEGVNGLSLSEVARRLGVQAAVDLQVLRLVAGHLRRPLRTWPAEPTSRSMRTAMARRRTGPRRARRRPRGQRPLGARPPGDRAAAVLAPGPQLPADPRGDGPERRDGPASNARRSPTPLRLASSAPVPTPTRRSGSHRSSSAASSARRWPTSRGFPGRGPLQPAAHQTSRHTRRPLPTAARPPPVVSLQGRRILGDLTANSQSRATRCGYARCPPADRRRRRQPAVDAGCRPPPPRLRGVDRRERARRARRDPA